MRRNAHGGVDMRRCLHRIHVRVIRTDKHGRSALGWHTVVCYRRAGDYRCRAHGTYGERFDSWASSHGLEVKP